MAQRITQRQLGSSALLLGLAIVTSTQGSITTEVDLTGFSVTITADGVRKIKVAVDIHMYSTVAGDFYRLFLKESTTVIHQWEGRFQTASGQEHFHFVHYFDTAPSAGSHTYKLSLVRASGSGTLSTFPSADRKDTIAVEAV